MKRLPGILTVASSVMLFASIPFMEHKVGYFGLVGGFPIIYFIGLAGLGLSAVVTLRAVKLNRYLLASQLLMLVMALWLFPIFIAQFAQ